MLNRYTTDNINAVFYKIVHQMTTTPMMPILFALEVMLNIGFFLGSTCWERRIEPVVFFWAVYSYIAAAQVLYLAFQEFSEYHKDGLDPSWGTRLSPWEVIIGQYLALAVIVLLALLVALPVWFVTVTIKPEISAMCLFWGAIILFSLGVMALGLSHKSFAVGNSSSPRNTPVAMIAVGMVVGVPIIGSVFNLSLLAGEGSLALHIQLLLILVPILVLVTLSHYGSLQPLSLEGYGPFRKAALGLVGYAFVATIIGSRLWTGEWLDWEDICGAYRIELLLLFLVYALSAGFERLHPTYRRRIYAQQNGRREYFTFPWQCGAVPGYLTAVLLSLVLIVITPGEIVERCYMAVFVWLVFPLMGVVLLVRNYIKEKLPTWAVIACVFAVIFALCIFPIREIAGILQLFARWRVGFFALLCYVSGIALAWPAIRNYYRELKE